MVISPDMLKELNAKIDYSKEDRTIRPFQHTDGKFYVYAHSFGWRDFETEKQALDFYLSYRDWEHQMEGG
jgi:hypothetical protein